uniref:RING-type E3 ubiquitin transferase n=1 Tax=Pogona vitticeps TaxID=103695 RepID=A0ABM5FHH9_9SAUR
MASATLQDLCEEATCSICLDYFEDPVTIECGHNFCRACLTQSWEGSEGEEASCPQCRSNVRRSLVSNRQLGNFVELTKKLRLEEEMRATGNERACDKHQEPLKLFCKNDEAPICVVCDKSKEHRDHKVVPLEEAVQDYKFPRELPNLKCIGGQGLNSALDGSQGSHLQPPEASEVEGAKILTHKAKTEEESQGLFKQRKAEMEKRKELFRELHSFLNEQEKLQLAHLEEGEKEIARERDEYLARLSEELSSLAGLIREMEKKRQQPPEEILQDVGNLLKSPKNKEPFQNPVAFLHDLCLEIGFIQNRNRFLAEKTKQFRDTVLSGSGLKKGY